MTAWPASRLAIALLLWLAAASAFAHASLIGATPADGALLAQAPPMLSLRFNEPVAPLLLKLLRPDGSALPIEDVGVVANGLDAHLPAMAMAGTYLLSWRVVSADGHPVGGSLAWSVGTRSQSAAGASPTTTTPALRALIWATRLALYAALFAGTGAALFRSFIASGAGPAPRWAARCLCIGLALVPVAVGLQGLDALASGWPELLTLAPWRASLGTSYGATAGLMLLALVAALSALAMRPRAARAASLAAVLLLGAAFAASGHASSAPPRWLARPAVFLHGLAVTAWIGSLVPLSLELRGLQGAAALQRFSRAIPYAIALLVSSGAALVLLQLDRPQALWTTDYGRILGAKLAVVALLLGAAAVNRYRLTDAIRRGAWQARGAMRRVIHVELLLAVIVLALVATWRFTPPPRALTAVAAPRVAYLHLHGEQAMVDLTVLPAADGRLVASLVVTTTGTAAPEPKELLLELSRPEAGIEPLQRPARLQPDGSWRAEPFALPAPGRWHVRVDVLVSDFEQARLEGDLDIAF